MKETILYNKLPNKSVQCRWCCHFCLVKNSGLGICQVKKNIDGILYSLNYGKIIAAHIDPIEKKPLYQYLPGTMTYSIASAGCNFKCQGCQNAEISQINSRLSTFNDSLPETSAENIINEDIKNSCPSISYTYTEPTMFADFALECMKLAKKSGLKNIWVSNGYMSKECLELISPYLDAINVDLKFFKEGSYQKIAGGKLAPILDNLIWLKKRGIHQEITTLIIPTVNDSDEELKQIADFIFTNLGAETPWHVSAFYPTYCLSHLPTTSPAKILEAVKIGRKAGLKFVYPGNI